MAFLCSTTGVRKANEVLKSLLSHKKKPARCPVWIPELRPDAHLVLPGNCMFFCISLRGIEAAEAVPVLSKQIYFVSFYWYWAPESLGMGKQRGWGKVAEEEVGWVLLLSWAPLSNDTHLSRPQILHSSLFSPSQMSHLNFDQIIPEEYEIKVHVTFAKSQQAFKCFAYLYDSTS